jgi:hypothetical protein
MRQQKAQNWSGTHLTSRNKPSYEMRFRMEFATIICTRKTIKVILRSKFNARSKRKFSVGKKRRKKFKKREKEEYRKYEKTVKRQKF